MSNLMDRWNQSWDNFTITLELDTVTQEYKAVGPLSTKLLKEVIASNRFDAKLYEQTMMLVSKYGYCIETREEEIIDLTKNTVSIPVYTVTDGAFLKMYCTECKPDTGIVQNGTFITSSYDNYCDGCGRDLKELAEGITDHD